MSTPALITAINKAIEAHTTWKHRLSHAILTGGCEISSKMACCDDQCQLGMWLYGNTIDHLTRAHVSYQEVQQLHAEFHRSAGSVLAYVERDMMSAAQFLMDGEFEVLSQMLIDALDEWKYALADNIFVTVPRAMPVEARLS